MTDQVFMLRAFRHYRAVLFDFYGTLTRGVRRGPAHAAVARRLGCDPDAFVAMLDATFRARATGVYGSDRESLREVAWALGVYPTERQLRVAAWARVSAIRADTHLRPEAVPVLHAVRQRGLRTALVSDCTDELPRFLPDLPIAPLLDACALSVRVRACKPDPAMYLTACDQLGVAPHECLYVGDGGGSELTGAQALGMDAVRLDAPDLVGHLNFEPDVGWTGPQVSVLTDILALLDGRRCPVTDLALAG
ncbi:MAG TPA: HAD family hydrolase [Rugosimonospora sp.]|nr:HAD family hydrolase [Rugosimonospora sp.]